jgi:hypothetical protein
MQDTLRENGRKRLPATVAAEFAPEALRPGPRNFEGSLGRPPRGGHQVQRTGFVFVEAPVVADLRFES